MTTTDYERIASWVKYCKDTPVDDLFIVVLAQLWASDPSFDCDSFLTSCEVGTVS